MGQYRLASLAAMDEFIRTHNVGYANADLRRLLSDAEGEVEDACLVLPKDAHGRAWHPGDEMLTNDGLAVRTVVAVDETHVYVKRKDEMVAIIADAAVHHDVKGALLSMLDAYGGEDKETLVERFAEKLSLKS